MLACLMHLSIFLSLAELKVDIILEEAKPEPYLSVFVIYFNACGPCLAEYFHFYSSVVKYYEQIEDSLRSKIYQ